MIQPRLEIDSLPPVFHGGFKSAESGVLDFSSNVNPFGPSPRVWDALRSVPIGQHPDPRAAPLRDFLAARENVDAAQILVGNGSVELIYALAIAYVRSGDPVLIVAPTFGEYTVASRIMGAKAVEFRLQAENNFVFDVDAFLARANEIKPRLIFLCNPNNPTGTYIHQEVVTRILVACPDTLLALDEAFVRFLPNPWSSNTLLEFENLLILRSLTKDYALTGLRVGYALASPSIITALEQVQPPWSVNSFAQVAAIAAVSDEDFFQQSLQHLAQAQVEFVQALTQIGLPSLPSLLSFFLVSVPSAKELTHQLLARNIRVRDGTSFGLPQLVRIATRRPEENLQLLTALREVKV